VDSPGKPENDEAEKGNEGLGEWAERESNERGLVTHPPFPVPRSLFPDNTRRGVKALTGVSMPPAVKGS